MTRLRKRIGYRQRPGTLITLPLQNPKIFCNAQAHRASRDGHQKYCPDAIGTHSCSESMVDKFAIYGFGLKINKRRGWDIRLFLQVMFIYSESLFHIG